MTQGKAKEGFMSDLFDYWSKHIDAEEFRFYESFAKRAGGPILEMASGAGRLLLPLKKLGLEVEGVESSSKLRYECQRQARLMGLDEPILYHKKMEDFSAEKLYALIFIALGSFQLIQTRVDAENTLRSIYQGLGEGGRAIISLTYPWIDRPLSESSEWRIVYDRKEVSKGLRFIRREKSYHDPVEQCIQGKVRSEMWQGKRLLKWQERELVLRWYSHYEFRLLLEKAGFREVILHQGYQAHKPKGRDFMIFEAIK